MRKAHIMGIEGVGMSALARLLMAEGVAVTGCDLAPGPRARRLGVPVHHGHDPGHLADEDTLVVPTPVPPDHPEVVEARKRGLRVLRRMELLAHFLAQRPSAGVTGTHGKTTTTGMLAATIAVGGLASWWWFSGDSRPPGYNIVLHEVKRDDFALDVTERGEIELERRTKPAAELGADGSA